MIYPPTPRGPQGGGFRPTLLGALMTGSIAADSNEQLPMSASLRQEVLPLSCRKCSGPRRALHICVYLSIYI